MSTARATHVPFTKGQQNGIGRKDIVTFYDASGVPKVSCLLSFSRYSYYILDFVG